MSSAVALEKAGIEAELTLLVAAVAPPLRSVICYALAGGKQARGLLLLAAGQAAPAAPDTPHAPVAQAGLLRAAACVELLHAATLVQDDIFDQGSLRRGHPATHIAFGLKLATLASDWMLAEATRCAYRLDPLFGEALSLCAQQMMLAEACEDAGPGAASPASLRAHARSVAEGKTGALFGLALSAASLLGGSRAHAERLRCTGLALGVAFQYLDDTLDLYGEQQAAGKELSRDLPAQLRTMPVVDALLLLPRATAASLLRAEPAAGATLQAALQTTAVREQILTRARANWEQAAAELAAVLPAESPAPALVRALMEAMLPASGSVLEAQSAA